MKNKRSIAAKKAWRERKARAAYYAAFGVIITDVGQVFGESEFAWKQAMAQISDVLKRDARTDR